MSDIQMSFEYAAHGNDLDFTANENKQYKSERTRKAFYWFSKGFIQGEKN